MVESELLSVEGREKGIRVNGGEKGDDIWEVLVYEVIERKMWSCGKKDVGDDDSRQRRELEECEEVRSCGSLWEFSAEKNGYFEGVFLLVWSSERLEE